MHLIHISHMELGTVNSRTKGDHASFICCNRPFMASLLFSLSLESEIGMYWCYISACGKWKHVILCLYTVKRPGLFNWAWLPQLHLENILRPCSEVFENVLHGDQRMFINAVLFFIHLTKMFCNLVPTWYA